MPNKLGREKFEVATDLYYVNVSILGPDGRPASAEASASAKATADKPVGRPFADRAPRTAAQCGPR